MRRKRKKLKRVRDMPFYVSRDVLHKSFFIFTNRHLLADPEGNSEFVSRDITVFVETKVERNIDK